MTKFTVENPTSKSKAVREAGGLTVIKPGAKAEVEAVWDDEYVAKLEVVGLKVKTGKAEAKADARPAPKSDDK